ncbi:MAG: hypothetical protein AB8G16_19835 [Gammaproteobacteria bacterium]
MEKALSVQPQAMAAAVQRSQRTPVASPSSADPPRAQRPISGSKPGMDSVSISNEARRMDAMPPPPEGGDRMQGPRSGAESDRGMRILGELKESFFTQEGDEGFNARLDFNSDGVINAGDLGMLREKMAGSGPTIRPPPQPEPVNEPEEVATLESIRDAFYTREGEDGFNAASDLNGDGVVNVQDLGLFRQSQGNDAQPVQPVPAPVTGGSEPAAATTAGPTIQSVTSEPQTTAVIEDPAPAVSTPATSGVSGIAVDPDAIGIATSASAGSAPAVDVASVRESLLDQLRNAFFTREGDDNFDATLDSNGDGQINVADFLSVRDSV